MYHTVMYITIVFQKTDPFVDKFELIVLYGGYFDSNCCLDLAICPLDPYLAMIGFNLGDLFGHWKVKRNLYIYVPSTLFPKIT